MKRKILCLFLVLALALTSALAVNAAGVRDIFGGKSVTRAHGEIPSAGVSGDNGTIHWELTSAGALTVSGSGAIPDYVNVGDLGWFDYYTDITSLTIQSGVTSIGYASFFYLTNLVSVSLPNGLEQIGDYAFYNCVQLSSITIPGSVTRIGYDAFYGCSNLASVTISDGVTEIGSEAFMLCTSLRELRIPSSVTTVGDSAFCLCEGLIAVYFLNDSVTLPSTAISNGLLPTETLVVANMNSSAYNFCSDRNTLARFVDLSGASYTVTLDLNANDAQMPLGFSSTVTKTVGVNEPLPVPTRDNYIFAGWAEDSNNHVIDVCFYDSLIETQADTLYAVWIDEQFLDLSSSPVSQYTADNNIFGGVSTKTSKLGLSNGATSNTWIRQSATWLEEGSTAQLRIDYDYIPASSYINRDVIFILDTSDSMANSNNIAAMTDIVAAMITGILDPQSNNRVAFAEFGTQLAKVKNFSSNRLDALDYIKSLRADSGGTNYDAGLAKGLEFINNRENSSRSPLLIFFSDGIPNVGNQVNGIYGGGSATAIKAAGCEISCVYLGNYTPGAQTQLEAISSSASKVYPAADSSELADAMRDAFIMASRPSRNITVKLDTDYFTTTNNAVIGGNCANSIVNINNNVITWDVSGLQEETNHYITVPLTINQNATPRSAGRGVAAGDYPTSLEGENIAKLHNVGESGTSINTVASPVLTVSNSPANTYKVRFVNEQGAAAQTVYTDVDGLADGATYTLPQTQNVTGFVDGVPVNGTNIFAGWFTTKAASQIGSLAPASAAGRTITIGAAADAADGNTDSIITLYAGWVAPGSVTRDQNDPNAGVNYQSGFSLEGVQIKSKDIPDAGVDHAMWEGAQYNGMRFVTVYSNGMISELDALHATGNPNYLAASENGVGYGYMMYAKADIANLSALNTNTSGAVDVDCTREGNLNHKMFTNYRLSTVVVKYADATEQSQAVEARAYVDYTDANGFARRAFNTYTGTNFAGGCRAVYNDAYTALTRIVA